MANNLTVVDVVQLALDNEAKMPLLLYNLTAFSLKEIIKLQFPHFSLSHINRLINQNAVKVGGTLVDNESVAMVSDDVVIQIGKRDYFILKIS
jgi:RNA-binding protein YlmH